MLTIGEFSRATSLTVKTIRFYHEKGLLAPARVEPLTGYRLYDEDSIERARVIQELRRLDFSLATIREILSSCEDEADVISFLEEKLDELDEKIRTYEGIRGSLRTLIDKEKEAAMAMNKAHLEVEEKTIAPILIAGIRTKGKYSDCGKIFAKLGRSVGRYICDKPMNLYYDGEYKEEDADFEPCFPIRKAVEAEGVSVREIPGGRCVSLLHRGPYNELGRSYERVFRYIRDKGLKPQLPSREVYIKGPGMIFKGNPKKYLTAIQVMVEG